MKRFFIFLFILVITLQLCAQEKMLTMEDAMLNARTTLAPENLPQLQFVKGTADYIYLKKTDGIYAYVRGNFKSKEDVIFLTIEQFNEKMRAASLDTLKTLPVLQFNNDNWILSIKGQKFAFNSLDKGYKVITDKSIADKENLEVSNDGYAAYLDTFNLYVSKNGAAKKVTEDGSRDIVYASTVHQSEFGITKGTFWSNTGKLLAFYRMDQSMVPDYPIIDWTQRPAKNDPIRYPMAGDKSHHVTVGVYNAATNSTTWIKTQGPAEQYLTNIAWSPDDRYLYIAVLNRGQNDMWLNEYDANTGMFIKTLFEETDNRYVEPLVPMLFVKNNPGQFIWQSKKDGWNHLYLYGSDGNLVRQLTGGQWEVLEVKGFDETGEYLFYTSTQESPISKNLYRVGIKTAKSKQVTQGTELHNTTVSTDGNYVIDNFSSPQLARTIQLVEVKSGKTKTLLQSKNPLKAYSLGQMDIFKIKNTEGSDLYCRLFKPANFDATKKYPVIVYWYGGPHAQLVLNSWNGGAGDYWFQYMAERGYVVFTLDTRGSANRGRAFEQAIFRRAGEVQMDDMMSGIRYLNTLVYADTSHMGLFGWSYGGFMTTNFMLNHPGVFKAAVAGGAVMDWKYYEIMYTERYMDTPEENPAGYESTNLLKQAGKLKGKLLLVHGLQDPVVVQQHSVLFVRAAIDKGVQVDYMIYPGHEHNVLGKDRAHLYQKVTDYFMQNLK
ncbi:MAG: DPP IV N-terminal domain-containing protein [Ferruginibacter sp.]|nr:DPP IV N-terminal domain-containing protein [Ferruginibacter sp.]